MDQSIFKAYDIRGIYPDQLNEQDAYDIARAFAVLIQREKPGRRLKIVVGQDMRTSSPALQERVVAGLIDSGADVVEAGLVSTPTFYFAAAFNEYDGGMQISASHNPKEYNGIKMVRARGVAIGRDTGMNDLKELALKKEFPETSDRGKIEKLDDITAIEVKEQREGIDISKIKPFKIVVDAANAMGAPDVEAMFSGLPCQLIKLNFELDGTFPVHQPDPLDEDNLKILQDAVKEHKADLGISPDGDGDRYFFVDDQGEIIRQEILRGIMAQIALREQPGSKVAYDIRPGRITRDMIEELNGQPVVTPVGHSLIKAMMVKEDAVFGGESSGHYFYKFPYGTFEAPVVFVTKFLVWLSKQNKSLSEAIAPYKKYFHSGEINSKVSNVKTKLEEIKHKFSDGELSELDGVTVEYEDWWFNVRGSNTEPLIRLNLEAKTKEIMEQRRDEVLELIRS